MATITSKCIYFKRIPVYMKKIPHREAINFVPFTCVVYNYNGISRTYLYKYPLSLLCGNYNRHLVKLAYCGGREGVRTLELVNLL